MTKKIPSFLSFVFKLAFMTHCAYWYRWCLRHNLLGQRLNPLNTPFIGVLLLIGCCMMVQRTDSEGGSAVTISDCNILRPIAKGCSASYCSNNWLSTAAISLGFLQVGEIFLAREEVHFYAYFYLYCFINKYEFIRSRLILQVVFIFTCTHERKCFQEMSECFISTF